MASDGPRPGESMVPGAPRRRRCRRPPTDPIPPFWRWLMRVPWKWLCLALPVSLLVACGKDRSPMATAPVRTSLGADYTNTPDVGSPYIARYEADQFWGSIDSKDGLVRA